jgi:enediyne polyketide synthase
VERAVGRSATQWADLLTRARLSLAQLVAAESGEAESVAATRAWSATECLVKAGLSAADPLTLVAIPQPSWTVFASGTARVATFAATLRGVDDPVVFAVLTGG